MRPDRTRRGPRGARIHFLRQSGILGGPRIAYRRTSPVPSTSATSGCPGRRPRSAWSPGRADAPLGGRDTGWVRAGHPRGSGRAPSSSASRPSSSEDVFFWRGGKRKNYPKTPGPTSDGGPGPISKLGGGSIIPHLDGSIRVTLDRNAPVRGRVPIGDADPARPGSPPSRTTWRSVAPNGKDDGHVDVLKHERAHVAAGAGPVPTAYFPSTCASGKFPDRKPPAGPGIRPRRGSSGAHAGKSFLRVRDGPGQRGTSPGRPSPLWVTRGQQCASYVHLPTWSHGGPSSRTS